MNEGTDCSYRKAAERLGIPEERIPAIVKAGKLKETDEGLIERNSLTAWLMDRKDIEGAVYSERVDATRQFEDNGRHARERATQEALEHYAKEMKDYADAEWNKWEKKARKDIEAEYAAIDARRLEKLKDLGAL